MQKDAILKCYHRQKIETECLIYADNRKERRFYVLGDFQSRETAESFVMFSDINNYREKKRPNQKTENINSKEDDILFSFIEDKENVHNVFENKTQGYNFHIPMLAAAMIVEEWYQ